eukprot:1556229-Prymnesium_polylepis.1
MLCPQVPQYSCPPLGRRLWPGCSPTRLCRVAGFTSFLRPPFFFVDGPRPAALRAGADASACAFGLYFDTGTLRSVAMRAAGGAFFETNESS